MTGAGHTGKRMMKKNILLTIEYDGSVFHGWQKQPETLTVQGRLEEVLSRLTGDAVLLSGTSRTDAGVHALGQRASFEADVRIPTERLARVINDALNGMEEDPFASSAIRIVKAEEMPQGFHARFDAKGKKYIYRLVDSPEMTVFDRKYAYHVKGRLDIGRMKEAASHMEGRHDFRSFEASGGNPRQTTVRTVYSVDIENAREETDIHVKGDGFLYNMVRIMTGTLVDVGLGRIDPASVKDIIEARDRRCAGHTAPPGGLYLAEVYYDMADLTGRR